MEELGDGVAGFPSGYVPHDEANDSGDDGASENAVFMNDCDDIREELFHGGVVVDELAGGSRNEPSRCGQVFEPELGERRNRRFRQQIGDDAMP